MKTSNETTKTIKTSTLYRIFTKDNKVKFAGTDHGSWFVSLKDAKANVDDTDMIYEYDKDCNKLWEVL